MALLHINNFDYFALNHLTKRLSRLPSNYSFYSNIIQRMSVELSCEIVQRQIIKNLVAVAPGTTEITDFVDEILDLKK